MLADSRRVELTRHFYDWEVRGRGWAAYTQPVVLEPPFRPFFHGSPATTVFDDSRRHTWLSSLVESLRGSGDKLEEAAEEPEEPLPRSDLRSDADEPLHEFLIAVPEDARITRGAVLGWLESLSVARGRIAFEVNGRGKRVEVRLATLREDAAHALEQLQAALPSASIRETADTLTDRWESAGGWPLVAFEFGLASEFMVPLAIGSPGEEPLLPVIAALASLEESELGLYQVLFEETREPWAESVLRSVVTPDERPFFADAPEITTFAKDKVSSPLFAVALRIAASASDEDRAWEIVRRLAGAVSHFGSPRTNELMPLSGSDPEALEGDLLGRTTHRSGMLLSAEELVSLIHLPGAGVHVPELWRGGEKSKAAPVEVLGQGCLLGFNEHAGGLAEAKLSVEAKTKHVHVIGSSGTGKSTLLLRMILEDIEAGHGVGLLDPHGDLVDEVAARVPEGRLAEVVLFDPSDEEAVVGWNILGAETESEKDILSSDLVGVFRRLSTSWGDQMTAVLGNAILVFLESKRGGTLLDLRRFLIDERFRKEMLATVPDPYAASFWENEFPLLIGKRPQAPILTRLDAFLRSRLVRRVVTVRKPKLDFRRLTDGGMIFLGKLAQGAIGEENAALLGSLLVSKFHQVTLAREAQALGARRPFFLYIDEFQHVATPSMASLFSGARKYRLGLTVAHQDLYQLHGSMPEVERSILGNAYTRICFRVGEEDARQLAKGLSFFTDEDLMRLPVGQAICRVGGRDGDFNLRVERLPPLDAAETTSRRERIRRLSRDRWGTKPEEEAGTPVESAQQSTAQVTATEVRTAHAASGGGLVTPAQGSEPASTPATAPGPPLQLEKPALDYMALVASAPFLAVRERNQELGLSAWRGQRIKTRLVQQGLAREVTINPGGRGERFKLLEITSSGREVLVRYGVSAPAGHGRGGIAHQWWIHTIASWLKERGTSPTVEDATAGARVDLSFSAGGERFALEVEIGEGHAAENIRKDLAAGYGRVVCLLDNPAWEAGLRHKLGAMPPGVLLGDLRAFGATLAPLLPTLPPLRGPNENTEPRRRRRPPATQRLTSEAAPVPLSEPGALSTPVAAEYLGLSPATLETLRTRGGGPPFVKLGRRVVYRREDLDGWLAQGRRSSTSDGGSKSR